MTKPCKLTREQREEARRKLEGYRASGTMLGQLKKLFDATLGRIDEARATLLTVQTPELRDAIQANIEAEEAALLKLHGYMIDYRGRMEAIEGTIMGGRLDPVSSELLRLRYLEGLPWLEIADRLGYTHDYARGNLHSRALEEYAAAAAARERGKPLGSRLEKRVSCPYRPEESATEGAQGRLRAVSSGPDPHTP